MTWIDNTGEVRPSSWEEYCEIEARTRSLPYWMTGTRVNYYPQPLHVRSRASGAKLVESREKVLRIRERLFRANPYCFWCGCKVQMGAINTPTQATVDHLYSRLHPERDTRHRRQKGVLHVLACSACNNERSVCEQRGQPFIPKLPERLEFAQKADATLAHGQRQNAPAPKVIKQVALQEEPTRIPMRVICTLEEAVKFARENPSR